MAAPSSRKFVPQISTFLRKISGCSGCHTLRRHQLTRCKSTYCNRTYTCGELRSSHIGDHVQLKGWVHHQRFGAFLVLRDSYGSVQLLIPQEKSEIVKSLPLESVVAVEGMVAARKTGETNEKMATGDIEVIVEKIDVLNKAKNIPFNIRIHDKVKESSRLEYRYLDLRTEMMQRNLRRRSKFINGIRNFLCQEHGFVEVETPTLFRRTPGGAREFIVPTHQPGKFYCLPQSPQQFKQLLMIGGMDRYMQIARCYRDESQRPDRQPEFTQLDVEMTFVNSDDVMNLMEAMLERCWPSERAPCRPPFARMTYDDVMNIYGTDKPDTRFAMEIIDVTVAMETTGLRTFERLSQPNQSVRAIVVRNAGVLKKKDLLQFEEFNSEKAFVTSLRIREDGSWRGSLANQLSDDIKARLSQELGQLQPSDVVVMACGERHHALTTLGKIRLLVADWLESRGHVIRGGGNAWLWVTDFPMFERGENGGWESAHHPFTAPHPDDLELIYSDPEKVRGLHYDLVLNGNEVGGGSIRIHDAELQSYVLHDVLKEDTSELRHLLQALEHGAPPHGGIALGLDRLCAVMCDVTNIREVIAFPKSLDGKDLMSKAPAAVDQSELDYYQIAPRDWNT